MSRLGWPLFWRNFEKSYSCPYERADLPAKTGLKRFSLEQRHLSTTLQLDESGLLHLFSFRMIGDTQIRVSSCKFDGERCLRRASWRA
jgi:hypothetical protein